MLHRLASTMLGPVDDSTRPPAESGQAPCKVGKGKGPDTDTVPRTALGCRGLVRNDTVAGRMTPAAWHRGAQQSAEAPRRVLFHSLCCGHVAMPELNPHFGPGGKCARCIALLAGRGTGTRHHASLPTLASNASHVGSLCFCAKDTECWCAKWTRRSWSQQQQLTAAAATPLLVRPLLAFSLAGWLIAAIAAFRDLSCICARESQTFPAE